MQVVPGSETQAGFKGGYPTLNADALPRSGFVQDELCGVPRYVAQPEINAVLRREHRAVRHIMVRLQSAQESHHIRLAGPSSNCPSCASSSQRLQRPFLRGKVRLGIDVCGIERHMSEPSTNRIDVDARLKKMAGGRVANYVGTDLFSVERRNRGTQLCDVAFDERVNAVTRQGLSATVQEQVRPGRTLPREVPELL